MSTDMTNWRQSEEWKREGRGFLVVVKHYTIPVQSGWDDSDGRNRWNVYAYIYPKHPNFAAFSGPDMWQDAATEMPFHAGPSLLRWHYDDDKKPTSVQVGSDYSHLHDDYFSHYATPQDAAEVFSDAAQLFDWLTKRA